MLRRRAHAARSIKSSKCYNLLMPILYKLIKYKPLKYIVLSNYLQISFIAFPITSQRESRFVIWLRSKNLFLEIFVTLPTRMIFLIRVFFLSFFFLLLFFASFFLPAAKDLNLNRHYFFWFFDYKDFEMQCATKL